MHLDTSLKAGERGQVLLGVAVLFTILATTIILGLVSPIVRQVEIGSDLAISNQSYFAAESLAEDLTYRFKSGKSTSVNESLSVGGANASAVITTGLNTQQIASIGTQGGLERAVQVSLERGSGASFHYAIQSGNGGFSMSQGASITGNVYSGGSVIGSGNAGHCNGISGFGNCVFGDVVSAGPSGLVYGITATGSVYAHMIGDSSTKTTTAKNAYYATTITNVYDPSNNPLPSGNKFPNSTDQPIAALPIADTQILQWESDAAAGGTLPSSACDTYAANTNTCTITSARTWGPKEIPFNLIVQNNAAVLTVTGPLWVVGNIQLKSGPTIKMDPGLGSQNVAIIADDPNNRTGSGVINIGQSSQFQGSGAQGSFVFMISWNTNAEAGGAANGVCAAGSFDALCMSQSSSALVAYASHGQMTFSQSASVKSATAYKIVLTQSANIVYDSGLPNTLFESGPSGSYSITGWNEVP